MNHSKVAIIGAGPAGISCAVQLKRYGIEPVLFEKKQIGGLLRNANLVENYLGFENGISGKDLVEKFKTNLKISDITPILSEVKKISFTEGIFRLETTNGLFTSKILVIASGTKPRELNTFCHLKHSCHPERSKGSVQLINTTTVQKWTDSSAMPQNDNKKIFYEIADLPKKDYSGKKFAIIGAGDTAFDYAINLVNNYKVSEVVILNRSDKAKCLPLLEKRAEETGKIKHIKNIQVDLISQPVIASDQRERGNLSIVKNSQSIRLLRRCTPRNDDSIIMDTDYIIVAIGREENRDFLNENLTKNSSDLQNQELLYFIGDVANGSYRQSSIATGDGIKAAMKINSKINTIYL
ncbi:MAG TPA: hypothetical protein DDW90_05280 [Cyanobacteria bacterium UBA9971]|nr:hypothetical protein [Cyanobacteria bacterium UBA9971]